MWSVKSLAVRPPPDTKLGKVVLPLTVFSTHALEASTTDFEGSGFALRVKAYHYGACWMDWKFGLAGATFALEACATSCTPFYLAHGTRRLRKSPKPQNYF